MQLNCRLVPQNDSIREKLVARLQALGQKPIIDETGAVTLDYDGACSGTPLSIITVFESFGCDRAIVFKDWGDNEGQDKTPKTMLKVSLEGAKAQT